MILLHNQESWPLTYCQHFTVAGTTTLSYSHEASTVSTLVAHKLVALVVHKHVALLAHTLVSTLVAHTLGLLVIMHKRRCLTVLVVIVGMAAKQRKSQRSLFNRFQWGRTALFAVFKIKSFGVLLSEINQKLWILAIWISTLKKSKTNVTLGAVWLISWISAHNEFWQATTIKIMVNQGIWEYFVAEDTMLRK